MRAVRRLYVERWPSQDDAEHYSVQVARGGKPASGIDPDRITYVEEEVKYWRKANHIHAWFVDNVQDGVDDCERYVISANALGMLLTTCEKVIEASKLVDGTIDAGTEYDADHPEGIALRRPGKVIEDASLAHQLLPTRSGFFFGSMEYDEDYLNEVRETREWAGRMLEQLAAKVPGTIYYESSW